MVHCVAINCQSSTDKGKRKEGISFHKFPWDRPAVLSTWVHNVRRQGWYPKKSSSQLCSVHFKEDCFIKDVQGQIMGEDFTSKRKKLKIDAVPTVFTFAFGRMGAVATPTPSHATVRRVRTHTERRIEVAEKRKVNWSMLYKSASIYFIMFDSE